MAEAIISPGVFTRENDISFVQPAAVEAGAAIIGPTVKGPKEKPTLVTSYSDYIRTFGATFESASASYEFMTSIAVKNYFSQGGNSVLVSRVVNGAFTAADSTNIECANESGVVSIGTNLLSSYTSGGTGGIAPGTFTGVATVASPAGGTALTVNVTTSRANGKLIAADVVTGALSGGTTLGNVAGPFTIAQTSTSGVGTGATFAVLGDGAGALTSVTTVAVGSGYVDGEVVTISAADLLAAGFTANDQTLAITLAATDILVETIAVTAAAAGAGYAIGNTLTIAAANIGTTDADLVLTLTAANIVNAIPFTLQTLGEGALFNNSTAATDPGAENADGSLVSGSADNLRWEVSNVSNSQGTFSLSLRQGNDNTKSRIILETFNNLSLDPNSPNYIEAVIGNQSSLLVDGVDGTYIRTSGQYVNRSKYARVSSVNLKTIDYLANDGVTVNTDAAGLSYSGSLPLPNSGSFEGATGTIAAGAKFFDDIDDTDTQGLVAGDYTSIINLLNNSEEYVFNIISAPGLAYSFATHITPIDSIISLAESRGDCIAVLDVQDYGATVSNVVAKATSINSSYAATYWPWLQVLSATGRNEWVPASAVIPGVYAFTDNSSAPWFAPAGLVRGGVAGVIQAERRLTRTQRDTLYSNKVNPIASFPGQGISVFGQKTLQTKASALDRVNVRRLLIELKKFIGDESRNLVFEQNTIATRNRFLATVNPYLESVVQRQGLYAYRVVMDDSNNTADVVDRNQLVGQIFIQPVKTAEFIVLDFTIEPTGATFVG